MLDLEPIKLDISCFSTGEFPEHHVTDLIAEVELLRRQLDEMMAFLMSVPDSVLCECGRVCELDVESV